jgi:uncharacterized protein
VDPDAVEWVALCEEATDAVVAAGFASVELDERGFRSGSLNELLAEPDRYR